MKGDPMETAINGKAAEWTDEIRAKWEAATQDAPPPFDAQLVLSANYFTPRPYVDEYNRGSQDEGFVYTMKRPNGAGVPGVWQCLIEQ
jgi:hypothetical protein